MPVAKKAQGGRVTVPHRPSLRPQQRCAANTPQGMDPGPSNVTAHPSKPNGSSAAGHAQPLLPSCGAACSGTLQVVLCNHSLWLTFHRQQNEMTLSRPGRAMFPSLAYQIRGMEPRARYRVSVDMVRTDQHHWRYEKAQWAPYRPEKSNVPGNQLYPHPHSPNTGAHWMKREVAFKTLRLTNAEPAAQSARRAIWLQSLHRYRPRLHVEELGCGDQEAPAAPSRNHIFSFPETEFIAVTTYHNVALIRLKIEHNPYARAFQRDAPSAGGLSAEPPPGAAAADPCAEAALDPAGQWPLLPEGRDRDRGSSTLGHGLQGPQPLWAQATALPPSLLPPTSAAATPSQDRQEATGSGTGEPLSLLPTSPGHRLDCLQYGPSKPQEPAPGAREQPRLHRETCTRGTQTDFPEAARGKRAPKKRRQCPDRSGSPAMSSVRAHRQAQAQRLPVTEGSANAYPEAASEDPGDLLVTEEAGVQEGDSGMPAACWAMQQPQQPLTCVFDSTPSSSSSSSSSNGLATWQVVNPGLQTSTAPLAMSYGSSQEHLFTLLQAPTFPAAPSQGTSRDCHPSLPLQPVLGAQEEPSVQQQIWPYLTQTELEDSTQAEGAPQKRSLSPQASGSQARCSGRDDGEAQDQLLTAAASSPYTFSEAASEDPGHLLGVQEAPTLNNRSGIPVPWSASQQFQPPLPSLFQATPSSSSSNDLSTLQVVTLNPDLQPSTAPLAASYGSSQESLLALLEVPTFPSESSQGTGDCHPSLPLHSVPGTQEESSVQQQIWTHMTQTELEDSAQAEGTPKKRRLSPASGRQARYSGRANEEAQDQHLTAAASSPYTFSEASEDPGHLLDVQETPTSNNSSGIPVLWSAPQQSQPPLHSLFQVTTSSSNSRSLPGLEDVAMGPSTSPLAMPYEPSSEEDLFSLLETSGCLSETSQGTSSDCLPSVPSQPMNPVPGAQEGQSLQEEIWTSLTETVSEDSPEAPRTSEMAPFSHNDYSGQDSPFTIADFYWDSLF